MGEFRRRMIAGIPPRGPQQVTVDISKHAQPVICPCGSEIFRQAVIVKTVPPLLSPTGQRLIVQQGVLICHKCEKPLLIDEAPEQTAPIISEAKGN